MAPSLVGLTRLTYPLIDSRHRAILMAWTMRLMLLEVTIELDAWFSWVLTWYTWRLGLCGQFTNICLGPPQYRHRRCARRRYFSASDNDPRRCVNSISIGVRPSLVMGIETCGGVATTEA